MAVRRFAQNVFRINAVRGHHVAREGQRPAAGDGLGGAPSTADPDTRSAIQSAPSARSHWKKKQTRDIH